MAVQFDLESMDPADRPDAIREISRDLNGKIEVFLPPDPAHLRASMTASKLGPVEISRIHWNVVALKRVAGPKADDIEPHVVLGLQESGTSRFAQGDRRTDIRQSDIVMLENVRPYEVAFSGPVRTIVVRVPTRVLGLPSALLGRLTAVRLGQERPVADAAAAFFSRLARGQAGVSETEAGLLAQPCIDLIRAMVTTGFGRDDLAREPLRHTLLHRVMAFVRLHLADQDLTAARIAAEHHVSVRQLYLTLSAGGISLGDWIRAGRLEECKRELASPARDHVTIEAIAHQWGFVSAAHFSRVFKAAYGMSPREWRGGNHRRPGQ